MPHTRSLKVNQIKIYWINSKRKALKRIQMKMATSCNNCSMKEKEQVYTSARDGNLMYLKVRFDLFYLYSVHSTYPPHCRRQENKHKMNMHAYLQTIVSLFNTENSCKDPNTICADRKKKCRVSNHHKLSSPHMKYRMNQTKKHSQNSIW